MELTWQWSVSEQGPLCLNPPWAAAVVRALTAEKHLRFFLSERGWAWPLVVSLTMG